MQKRELVRNWTRETNTTTISNIISGGGGDSGRRKKCIMKFIGTKNPTFMLYCAIDNVCVFVEREKERTHWQPVSQSDSQQR